MISYHFPLALYARSHYLPLALLACLQLLRVLQSPLSLWKTLKEAALEGQTQGKPRLGRSGVVTNPLQWPPGKENLNNLGVLLYLQRKIF